MLNREVGANVPLNIRMYYDNPGALRAAVQSGLGIGVLYDDMVTHELQSGSMKEMPIEGTELRGHTYIAYLKEKELSSVAREFVEFVERRSHGDHSATNRSPSNIDPLRHYDSRRNLKNLRASYLLTER